MTADNKRQTYHSFIDHLDNLTQEIREELDEHLDSINENTEEISIQNSAVCEIDNRLNKIEEKMDQMHFMFRQLMRNSLVSVDLTKDEQKIFLVLYTHDGFLSSEDVTSKSKVEVDTVEECLMALMDKGIPVEREIINKKVYFRMNSEFRLRQAKEQIVKISPEIKCQFQNSLLKKFFRD